MELILKTAEQRAIADLLWVCQSDEEVAVILKVFGTEAVVVRDLMIAAAFDEVTETHLAERVLVDIMSK
jgi:hypothetical protein